MYKILAVDDDPKNIKLIQGFIGEHFEILTAYDGLEAFDILEEKHKTIDAVVLDRMMPNMNGMELTAKIKAHPEMKNIPIIMQTAAAHQEQIVEGIKAGVYYYLTKPYDGALLLALINDAIQFYRRKNALLLEIKKYKKVLNLVEECRLSIRTLSEVEDVTAYLANLFPVPENQVVGISELIVNAIEHGNLGIDYHAKTKFRIENRWNEEVERLQELPQNANKVVNIHFKRTEEMASITIKDEGKGFNWKPFFNFDPARATDPHGRGIAISRLVSFDSIEYLGNGNEVCCMVKYNKN